VRKLSNIDFSVGEKYKDFMKSDAILEVLEGTMASAKTTNGKVKYGLKVMKSDKKIHFIGGKDIGTIERNIIKSEIGLLDIFGDLMEYHSKGAGEFSIPHIVVHSPKGDKYILLFGYSNENSYVRLRGGRYGCGMIDECNMSTEKFLIEGIGRSDEYCLLTLNPDDPNKNVYKNYINHCRSTNKWEFDTPKEILNQLTESPKEGWVHWFFKFEDNIHLSNELIQKMKDSVAEGTQQYKNLILGLRCKATGLVFPHFGEKNIIKKEDLKNVEFVSFSSGLDTSYSPTSFDTLSMIFTGISKDRKLYVLDELVLNNKGRDIPFAPSDIAKWYVSFLDKNKKEYGNFSNVYVDSADKATMTELLKYKRMNNDCKYIFNDSYKKFGILDRIHAVSGWMQTGHYLVLDHCKEHIRELNNYEWDENKINTPCDLNNHTIDSCNYSWIKNRNMIGINLKGDR
jgi:PBSX family phage terminase large subunit